jgi:hypothetical protein
VGIGASYIDSHRPNDLDFPFVDRRLAGPHVSATFAGAETTPYTGVRRALLLTTEAAAYPQPWTTLPFSFYDLRGQVAVTTPLPLARRQTLTLSGRARNLAGAEGHFPMLQVGGSLLGTLWQNNVQQPEIATPFLPVTVPFYEPLRGFEDYPIFTNAAYIGDATYKYRFIIDRGWASTLWVLPALFVRQLDLSLFTSLASANGRHQAAGGALTLGIVIWQIPFGVTYQLARRLTDDHAIAQFVSLGF